MSEQKTAIKIKIEKRTYNTIRSFVDSSLKPQYSWNKPKYAPGSGIGFQTSIKNVEVNTDIIYGTGKRWRLYIGRAGRGLDAGITIIVIYDEIYAYGQGGLLITCGGSRCRFYPNTAKENEYIDNVDINNIFFTADVPFANMISLGEVVDKMQKYPYVEFRVLEFDYSS